MAAMCLSGCNWGFYYDNIYEDESLFPACVVHLKEIKDITQTSAVVSFVCESEEPVTGCYINVSEKAAPEEYWSITSPSSDKEQEFLIEDLEPDTEYLVRAIFTRPEASSYFLSFNKPFKTLGQQ